MRKRNNYSEEKKASALAALLQGQSLSHVAREYNIPKGTLAGWKKKDIPNDPKQKKDIGKLLLGYLETNLESLRVQAEFFKTEEWLKKQNAADVAVLHGVMTDKAVRLMEAFNASNNTTGD